MVPKFAKNIQLYNWNYQEQSFSLNFSIFVNSSLFFLYFLFVKGFIEAITYLLHWFNIVYLDKFFNF